MVQNENTIIFKRTHLYAVLLPLAFVVGLAVGFLFWGRDGGGPAPAAPAQAAADTDSAAVDTSAAAAQDQQIKRYDVPVDDDPALGPENAAITIIEFSDYECPFCKRWHDEVFVPLQQKYSDQVRIVYRDFPLPNHPNAQPAAEAANCANEQGAFWEYHNLLFTNTASLNEQAYKQYASDLGLEMASFEECLSSRRYQEEVQADFDFAANLGVRSTPTFFINGIPVVGAQPIEIFEEVIQKELAGEFPK